MPNTTPPPAPPGALDATPQPDVCIAFGEFARFMQKEQYNAIEPMKNTSNQPLICLGKYPNNNAVAAIPTVRIETNKTPTGSWESVGWVNGKRTCSCSNRDKNDTIQQVRKMLAENDHYAPKDLAPVMSARLPKKSNRKAA